MYIQAIHDCVYKSYTALTRALHGPYTGLTWPLHGPYTALSRALHKCARASHYGSPQLVCYNLYAICTSIISWAIKLSMVMFLRVTERKFSA